MPQKARGVVLGILLVGGDEARETAEWAVGPFRSTETEQSAESAPAISEYPWQLVRTCSDTYGYTLFHKATGTVYRDYYGPEGEDGLPENTGFMIVERSQETNR